MTLLSTVLPGLRDFRAPFSAGVLWVTAIALLLFPHRNAIARDGEAEDLVAAISLIPLATLIAALAFLSYILGIVGTAATQRLRAIYTGWASTPTPQGEVSGFRRLLSPFNSSSHRAYELLGQHVRARLESLSDPISRDAGIVDMAADDRELTAFRLSRDAPEQYQQYDKTLAEAEFRAAVALPVLMVSVVAATYLSGLWDIAAVVVGGVTFFVLEARAAAGYRRSAELLSTTVFLEYTSPPSLDVIEQRIKSDLIGRDGRTVDVDLAWLIHYMAREDMRGYMSEALSKARHPSRANAVIEALDAKSHSYDAIKDLLAERKNIDGLSVAPHNQVDLGKWVEKNLYHPKKRRWWSRSPKK